MYLQGLPARPGVLDNGRLADVKGLLNDVELAKGIEFCWTQNRLDGSGVLMMHVAHVPEPVVDQP